MQFKPDHDRETYLAALDGNALEFNPGLRAYNPAANFGQPYVDFCTKQAPAILQEAVLKVTHNPPPHTQSCGTTAALQHCDLCANMRIASAIVTRLGP